MEFLPEGPALGPLPGVLGVGGLFLAALAAAASAPSGLLFPCGDGSSDRGGGTLVGWWPKSGPSPRIGTKINK